MSRKLFSTQRHKSKGLSPAKYQAMVQLWFWVDVSERYWPPPLPTESTPTQRTAESAPLQYYSSSSTQPSLCLAEDVFE